MKKVVANCAKMLRSWTLVNGSEDAMQLESWARALEARSARPKRLAPPDDVEGLEADDNLALNNLAGDLRDGVSEAGRSCDVLNIDVSVGRLH
jgi:hypothetical protein